MIGGKLDPSPVSIDTLVEMLEVNISDSEFYQELLGSKTPPLRIAHLLEQLRPLAILFKHSSVLNDQTLDFIKSHRELFDISNFGSIGLRAISSVDLFRKLSEESHKNKQNPTDLAELLSIFNSQDKFQEANQVFLAALLGCDLGLLKSLQDNLELSDSPFEVLQELLNAVVLTQYLGVGGGMLKDVQSSDYDGLASASKALLSGFRAKYTDEDEWEEKSETFKNTLLSQRRNGLVAYLSHSYREQATGGGVFKRFEDATDLYNYFLLDVELDGCARTSRIAAAIASVQLYVRRCLMNLEETAPEYPFPAHVLPNSIPSDQWEWLENYRIWEAHKKITLYPENYIEPELRHDKTPLFRALEEELLSKEITDEAVFEAYGEISTWI